MNINSTQALSVSELNRSVAQLLQTQLPMLRIQGEAQGVKRYPSGHVYFTLKDSTASISCVMFKLRAQLFDRLPREGELIEVRAKVTLYEPRGDYQLRIDAWQSAGQGALFESFLQLKAKLTDEGLLDEARKRPLPVFPKRIGLITSPHAAVLRDVATTLARRAPHITCILYPCAVQGEQAGAQLAQTVHQVSARAKQDGLDLLIICRGGGSMEDLWCFNHEQLAREIAACSIPVISGVGHDTDFTICDFVADLRAPTPTAAAELCATTTDEWHAVLQDINDRLNSAIQDTLAKHAQHLDHLQHRLNQANPAARLSHNQQQLKHLKQQLQWYIQAYLNHAQKQVTQLNQRVIRPDLQQVSQSLSNLQERLQLAAQRQIERQHNLLKRHDASLSALNPQRVLERGYAMVFTADNANILTAPAPQGTHVHIHYAQGKQAATLEQKLP